MANADKFREKNERLYGLPPCRNETGSNSIMLTYTNFEQKINNAEYQGIGRHPPSFLNIVEKKSVF